MSIRTILVPLDGAEKSYEVLEAALVVARRFNAHIAVLHISASAIKSATYANFPRSLRDMVMEEENKALLSAANEVRSRIESFSKKRKLILSDKPVKEKGVTIAFYHEFGAVNDVLIKWSRLYDTIAVNRPQNNPNELNRSQIGSSLEAVMMESGRPILIVPPDWQARKCRHAVIGWNHSHEASRALAMTIPWLTQMKEVTVVVSRRRSKSGERVKEQLAWHGINAEVKILNRRTSSAGKRLLKVCEQVGGDFLVLGGFSQPRLKERIFGGVTNHVLNHSNVITVMVH